MEKYIKTILREELNKVVNKNYLVGLLGNVSNPLGKKLLSQWIAKCVNDVVTLSGKEYALLNIIKSGGILPTNFHSKN